MSNVNYCKFHLQLKMSNRNGISFNMFSNYAKEIEDHWKHKERHRKEIEFRSPQLHLRSHLVEWLRSVSAKSNLSNRTVHLAVHILDVFMDQHSITTERLGFVGLVCLMLAAKFEEIDSKIPKISELNKYDGFRYSNKDFIAVEVMVLKCLDFELMQPTVLHFTEYYSIMVVLPNDIHTSKFSFRKLRELALGITTDFVHISLKESKFLQYVPSRVAAACLLATRIQMSLSPPWPSALADLTGYSESSLAHLVILHIRIYKENKMKKSRYTQSPDHGYVSETP